MIPLFNRPLAMESAHLNLLTALYRAGGKRAWMDDRDDMTRPVSEDQNFCRVGNLAIIQVRGCLANETSWWWGGTSYRQIAQGMMQAIGDDSIAGIALHVDSPGGEVSGCFDLADAIYAARGPKPIWSILEEHAYSAAYAIASSADRIIVPRTGGTGSIGVITQHVDITGMLEKAGIEVNTIHFGARKADSYDTTKMTDPIRERIQADVDMMGEMFVSTVSRNRKISPEAVRATEAGTFLGSAGVAAGLADAVMPPLAAFKELIESL